MCLFAHVQPQETVPVSEKAGSGFNFDRDDRIMAREFEFVTLAVFCTSSPARD